MTLAIALISFILPLFVFCKAVCGHLHIFIDEVIDWWWIGVKYDNELRFVRINEIKDFVSNNQLIIWDLISSSVDRFYYLNPHRDSLTRYASLVCCLFSSRYIVN